MRRKLQPARDRPRSSSRPRPPRTGGPQATTPRHAVTEGVPLAAIETLPVIEPLALDEEEDVPLAV